METEFREAQVFTHYCEAEDISEAKQPDSYSELRVPLQIQCLLQNRHKESNELLLSVDVEEEKLINQNGEV